MSDLLVRSKPLGVVNVHLLSGEDVIGRTTHNVMAHEYVIERPMMPQISIDQQNGQYRVGLLPLRPYLEKVESVTIPESSVAYILECHQRMSEVWQQATSDIQIAPAGVLPPLPPNVTPFKK